MKIKESNVHYISLFSGFACFFLVAIGGWGLAEQSVWFAQYWEHKPTRFFFIFACTIGMMILAVYSYSYFWGRKKFIRTYKEIGRKRLDKCKDNELVRVQGEVFLLGEPLIAPLSNKKCAAYETKVLKKEDVTTLNGSEGHVGSNTIWQTIKIVKESRDFLIQGEESIGLIRVNGGKLKICLDITHDQSSYKKDRGGFLTEEENTIRQRTLKQMGLPYKSFVGAYSRDIKFEEGVLEQGKQVAVRGVGKWISTANSEELFFLNKDGVKKVFEIVNSEDNQLHLSNLLYVLEK
jgi:hypothetical protein